MDEMTIQRAGMECHRKIRRKDVRYDEMAAISGTVKYYAQISLQPR